MRVGIEKINLYAGRLRFDILELAAARGKDSAYIKNDLMCKSRSVYPAYEDTVTLAVNAAKDILSPDDKKDIELLIVGTESAVDFSKPVASWVHRFSGLPANCRNLDIKHACYSGTGALKMAASWVASGVRPGKKALVVTSDLSRSHIGNDPEIICGGCAVAMLISSDPQILEIEMDKTGYWTSEIADIFRPTAKIETGNNQASLYSYLDALEGAYEHYLKISGEVDFNSHFKKHIYHAPFPGMTFQAHRMMMNRAGAVKKSAIMESFREKVEEGIVFSQQIGSAYGGSNFVSLIGLLDVSSDIKAGDRISLFSYGSGCQGEFYSATVGATAVNAVRSLQFRRYLSDRMRLNLEEYESIELARDRNIDLPDFKPERDLVYEKQYDGQGLLVLNEVKQFYRDYKWS